jgi:capsular polysaccharide biosynthesis protein
MELKHTWQIIWKRAWIPALLLPVVAIASLLTEQTPPPTYSTTMRFTMGVMPQELANQYTYDKYYAWLASEYLTDDMSVIVSSQEFAADVNRQLSEMGSPVQIPPGRIGGVTVAEKQHRILRLNISWDKADELADIAQAVITLMEQDSSKYLTQLGSSTAQVKVIDFPSPPAANPPSLTQRLNLPVRLLLALIAGLALIFLLDYLDDSVRGRPELEALGIAVLAEVPGKTRSLKDRERQ